MQNFFAPQKQLRSVFDDDTPQVMASSATPARNAPAADYSGYEDLYNSEPEQEYGYESNTPVMDEFTNTVLNPPQRRGPSAMRMLGTGLLSALQGSTGPESRVPLYNEKGKKVGEREAGFFESLGNKPYNVKQANEILDMPYDAEVEDFKTKAEQQYKAAGIEKTREEKAALAEQRRATARVAIPSQAEARGKTADAAVTRANASMMNAQTAAFIHNMTDAQKLEALQSGKVTLQEMQDAAAMMRTNANNVAAQGRVDTQQAGATQRTGMQEAGDTSRNNASIQAGIEKAQMQGATVMNVPDSANPGQSKAIWINPRTQKWEDVPVPGGGNLGAVQKPGTPSAKGGKESAREVERLAGVRNQASRTIEAMDDVIDPKTGKLSDDVAEAVGPSKMNPLGYIPGHPIQSGTLKVERLKNLLTVDLMSELKKQSASGATGFGNMSNKDLGVLEKAASLLNTNLSDEEFVKELKRIRPHLDSILQPGPNIEVAQIPDKPGTVSATKLTPQQVIERARARRQQGVSR